MKKLFYTLTLFLIVGTLSNPIFASNTSTKIELKKDDKKKKKKKKRGKKKASCSTVKSSCGTSEMKKSCCSKGKN